MRRVLLLAVLMCGAVYAYAGPTEFTFVNWNGGNWQNGYPYYIEPTNGPVGQIYAVMCDDYAHGGSPGDQWEANITDLGSGNITLTRFNTVVAGPTALTPLGLYNEAGWILLETQVEPSNQWMQMNYAVWNIFDPAAPCNNTCEAWITAAEQAVKLLPQSYFDDVFIVTPLDAHNPDPNSIQEFMYIGQPQSEGSSGPGGNAPEPGTWLLTGTGALALFRKRFFS